jgi:hypothetical protein
VNNKLPLYAVSWLLLSAVSFPSRSAEQSTQVDVTEGNDIGFATVADALATLKSQGLAAVPGSNGDILIIEPNNKAMWSFTAKEGPAYPSAVRYVFTKTSGVLHAEFTILCEASAGQCEKFRSDIRGNVVQLSKMIAGDPPVKCSWNGRTMKCEPVRATGSLD